MASQGPRYPTVAASVGPGDFPWDTPDGIKTEGGSFDAAINNNPGGFSEFLQGTNFGFTIPGGATINGIEFTINVVNNGLGHYHDQAMQVLKGGVLSTGSTGLGGEWPATPPTPENRTYGGPTELWGETWTPANINATNFGVSIQGWEQGGIETTIATVEFAKVTVYYTAAGGGSTTPVRSTAAVTVMPSRTTSTGSRIA